MIGHWIDQFQIVEIIGQGGMSTVYRGTQPSFGRDVAIKILPRQLSEDPTFLKRFQREARMIARLEHRSILPVYDYGEQDGIPYIVMRLMEGGTLRKKLFHEGLDMASAVRVIEEVAEALDYAHTHGVIHRDLKPSNILLDGDGNAYLTDFGIAKMLGSTSQVTGSGVVGTPSYMSPEQCQGKPLGPASDIYALGAILFEVLTGTPPFEADTPLTVMYMHVKDPIPSAYQRNPNLPPAVDVVIGKAMAKNPAARYSSAQELATAFRRAVGAGGAMPASQPATSLAYPTPPEAYDAGDTEPAIPVVPPGSYAAEEASYDLSEALEEVSGPAGVRPNTSLLSVVGGILIIALMVGAAGVALSAMAASSQNGFRFPTLPPPGTITVIVVSDMPSPIPPSVTETLITPGGIIEPTELPSATFTQPSSNTPPPTAVVPTNTAIPSATLPPTLTPTTTPTPTSTETFTPTPSPTNTATQDQGAGSGLIVFTSGVGTAAEIVVIDTSGNNRRQITTNGYYDGEPDWSPNGSRIAFDSSPGLNRDIYTMAADGTNVRQITVTPSDERHPDWSPDGTKIAYESGTEDDAEVFVINADGTGVIQLTNNAFGDRAPQFSHSGTKIAYMTNQRGKWEIAIMSYPGGQQLQIFDCPAPDCRFPSWAADDSFLAYNTLDSNGDVAEVWEVNVATGASSVLIPGSDKGRPNYSGDGQYCYFNATIDGNTDLYRINVNTLAIQRLTISPDSEYAPDWGPG